MPESEFELEIRTEIQNRGRRSPRASRSNRCPDSGRRNQIRPRTRIPVPAEVSPRNHPRTSDRAPSKSPAKTKVAGDKVEKDEGERLSGLRERIRTRRRCWLKRRPSFDTYESRRRARFLMGGLSATCVLLLGWIMYRTFLYDPSPIDIPMDDADDRAAGRSRTQALEGRRGPLHVQSGTGACTGTGSPIRPSPC